MFLFSTSEDGSILLLLSLFVYLSFNPGHCCFLHPLHLDEMPIQTFDVFGLPKNGQSGFYLLPGEKDKPKPSRRLAFTHSLQLALPGALPRQFF